MFAKRVCGWRRKNHSCGGEQSLRVARDRQLRKGALSASIRTSQHQRKSLLTSVRHSMLIVCALKRSHLRHRRVGACPGTPRKHRSGDQSLSAGNACADFDNIERQSCAGIGSVSKSQAPPSFLQVLYLFDTERQDAKHEAQAAPMPPRAFSELREESRLPTDQGPSGFGQASVSPTPFS